MAFPVSSVIDNFTRADETPIATNWTTPMFTGDSAGPDLISNQADFTPGTAYWDVTSFGPDMEAYFTIINKPPSGSISVRVRCQGVGTATKTYYEVRWWGDSDEWYLYKMVANTETQIATGTRSFASGDKMGLEVIGNVIRFLHYSSGAWAQVTSQNDSAISGAGYIGFGSDDGGSIVDDFGGGTVSSVTLDTVLPDADVTTTGWSTAPLFSKINDDSDATVITATAS